MKYKHIVFDFGNVLGTFDANQLLAPFCKKEEQDIFSKAVMHNWQALDEGTVTYEAYIEQALALLPEHLHENARQFFKDWVKHLTPLTHVWEWIPELKKQGYGIYLLSNAPTYFAEHADDFAILKYFDGIVFSGPVNMWKPNPDIYQHLFHTYHLMPADCFFIDDREENILAANALGMDGMIFTGDLEAVKNMIYE